MDDRVGTKIRRRPQRDQLGARNLRARNAQPEHGGRQVLGRLHRLLSPQNLLRPWNFVRVDETVAVMAEAGPKPCSRAERKDHAAGAAMKIQDEIGAGGFTGNAGPDVVDIGVPFENRREAWLDDDADFEIGPMSFEQRQGGGGEDTVAQRPQTDHIDPRARPQAIQQMVHLLRGATLRCGPRPPASPEYRREWGKRAYTAHTSSRFHPASFQPAPCTADRRGSPANPC